MESTGGDTRLRLKQMVWNLAISKSTSFPKTQTLEEHTASSYSVFHTYFDRQIHKTYLKMKIPFLAIFSLLFVGQAMACTTSGSECGNGEVGDKACSCADNTRLVSRMQQQCMLEVFVLILSSSCIVLEPLVTVLDGSSSSDALMAVSIGHANK